MQDKPNKIWNYKYLLWELLRREGYVCVSSATNSVMFSLKMDSKRLVEEMGKRGVSMRKWALNN